MPDGFLLGALFGALLLIAGLTAGLLIGRYLFVSRRSEEAAELHPLLSGMMRFTKSFSRDVSEYRTLIEEAAQRAQALSPDDESGENPGATPAALLGQIMLANEHLRKRLDEAEASLRSQSAEIDSYINEARTDALTGLPNRRALDDDLARRVALYRRQQTPLAVLLIDVDRFKSVNDRFGHHGGDEVLRTVAHTLQGITRDSDLVARYGGEEFAMLVSGASANEFQQAAERVRRAIEQATIVVGSVSLQVTVSCGVAEIQPGEDAAALVRRADEALYASKAGGRNCSHWHDGRRSLRIAEPTPPAASSTPTASVSESFREVCSELRRKLLEVTK